MSARSATALWAAIVSSRASGAGRARICSMAVVCSSGSRAVIRVVVPCAEMRLIMVSASFGLFDYDGRCD